jgi:hypothetical protein
VAFACQAFKEPLHNEIRITGAASRALVENDEIFTVFETVISSWKPRRRGTGTLSTDTDTDTDTDRG